MLTVVRVDLTLILVLLKRWLDLLLLLIIPKRMLTVVRAEFKLYLIVDKEVDRSSIASDNAKRKDHHQKCWIK